MCIVRKSVVRRREDGTGKSVEEGRNKRRIGPIRDKKPRRRDGVEVGVWYLHTTSVKASVEGNGWRDTCDGEGGVGAVR